MSTVTPKLGLTKPVGTEEFSLPTYNNNLDVIDNYATNTVEKLAKGLVYYNAVNSSSGTVTDAIVNNIASFTFKAGRRYRIIWDFSYYASGNSDSLFYCSVNFASVSDAAASLTGLTLQQGRTKGLITTYSLQSTQYTGAITSYYTTAADLTTQVKFRAQRVVGDDGIIFVGNANEPVVYAIYDDGAQI